jgi:hypothetical protein
MVKFIVFSSLNITSFEIFLPHDFLIKTYEARSLLLFDHDLSIAVGAECGPDTNQ